MSSTFSGFMSEIMDSLPDGPNVFLLQIGAGDGTTGDLIHPYLVRKGWRALLLEPEATAFERLCQVYANTPDVRCCQIAISDRDGPQNFYSVRNIEGLPWWADQISSLKRDVIMSHQPMIPDLAGRLDIRSVSCQRVETLIREHSIEAVDIVAVDTEGLDALIVSDILLAGLAPKVLLFEHKHLPTDVRAALHEQLQEHYTVVNGPYDTLCILRNSSSAPVPDFGCKGLVYE